MTQLDNPECVVPDCWPAGQHVTSCDDYTKCGGCAPGLHAPGSLVCRHHRKRPVERLELLPDLYGRLGVAMAPYRSPQAPKGDGGRSSVDRDYIDARAFKAREDILNRLSTLAAYIKGEQQLAGRIPGDVTGLVAYVVRHADWLSRNPLAAPRWGQQVDDVADAALRVVNRDRVSGLYLGDCPELVVAAIGDDGRDVQREPCGGPIRYEREAEDPLWQITCPACGKTETAEWWRQQIATDVADETMLPSAQVAMWLSVKYVVQLRVREKQITDSTVRKWKLRGELSGWVSWQDLTTKRVTTLYDRAEVEAHARKVYDLDELEAAS